MNTPWTPPPSDGGPGAVPLAAPQAKIRPGRIWYLVGLLVFLGGVAWLVVGIVSVFSHVNSFPRVAVPAGGQVSLDHSGGYVIYYEGPGAQSGRIPPFQVRVTPASAGAAVRSLAPYSGSLTYSNGSHQGSAVLTLQVTHPGRFTVETPGGTNSGRQRSRVRRQLRARPGGQHRGRRTAHPGRAGRADSDLHHPDREDQPRPVAGTRLVAASRTAHATPPTPPPPTSPPPTSPPPTSPPPTSPPPTSPPPTSPPPIPPSQQPPPQP